MKKEQDDYAARYFDIIADLRDELRIVTRRYDLMRESAQALRDHPPGMLGNAYREFFKEFDAIEQGTKR